MFTLLVFAYFVSGYCEEVHDSKEVFVLEPLNANLAGFMKEVSLNTPAPKQKRHRKNKKTKTNPQAGLEQLLDKQVGEKLHEIANQNNDDKDAEYPDTLAAVDRIADEFMKNLNNDQVSSEEVPVLRNRDEDVDLNYDLDGNLRISF